MSRDPAFTDPAEVQDWTYVREGVVLTIVDGDTVDLDISLGFRLRMQQRFRLYGINTPERGQPGWREAGDYLASLIPAGSRVTLRSYKPQVMPKADSFGRWVVEIFAGELNVNQQMIDAGHAVPFMRDKGEVR